MATRQNKTTEPGMVGRLSRRGEETLGRLMDELGRNERVTDAFGRAMTAKGKLDTASKRALHQVGLAPLDDLEELRKQVNRLEKRLAKIEGASGGKATAKRSETKKTSSARRRTTRAKTGTTEKAPSPPAGRALGGGTGRGASAGGGTAAA
jgi:septal ring factor EnvC (AmiA/AmiB activator)